MVIAQAPLDRNGFKVAIICALPLEAEMVELVLDKDWRQDENRTYGRALGDTNAYTLGAIGPHNVVLAYMPGMGSNSAASVASGLRSSFPEVKIAFVVGICGVVPIHPQTKEEIILGDCIISTTVVQYDFGREYPLGFKRKQNIEDSLGRANPEIRAYISMLTTRRNRQNLNMQMLEYLESMQQEYTDLIQPPRRLDRLFEPTYVHQHRPEGTTCGKCLVHFGTCTRDCDELDCEDKYLVPRSRSSVGSDASEPRIHFGRFGTANTVMKSGKRRDEIKAEDEITAFEMEGSGVWDTLPTIIIKAACDYADSHKSKYWQPYAAATAATCLKAVLYRWEGSAQALGNNVSGIPLQTPQPLATGFDTGEVSIGQDRQPAVSSLDTGYYSRSESSSENKVIQAPLQNPSGISRTKAMQSQPNEASHFMPPKSTSMDIFAMSEAVAEAARLGDLAKIISLHKRGALLDKEFWDLNRNDFTALSRAADKWFELHEKTHNRVFSFEGVEARAAMKSQLDIIKYLLSNGVKWDSLPPGPVRSTLFDTLHNETNTRPSKFVDAHDETLARSKR